MRGDESISRLIIASWRTFRLRPASVYFTLSVNLKNGAWKKRGGQPAMLFSFAVKRTTVPPFTLT